MMNKRVLIIEDSKVIATLLEHIINSDPELEVVGIASSGEEGISLVSKFKPDVISMDIRLPGIDGLKTTSIIMTENPTPIVVISESIDDPGLNIAMNALKVGALSVLEKPVNFQNENYERIAEKIITQLKIMSDVKVIRQHLSWINKKTEIPLVERVNEIELSKNYKIMGIVASTGGPNAILEVLNGLTDSFNIPIVCVQHITESFMESFVSWLNQNTHFTVKAVSSREELLPGHVYLTPKPQHLVVNENYVYLEESPPIHSQKPSGSILFKSIAENFGNKSIGVLLTGMGEDGADTLKDIKDLGGLTICESEKTAIIFGMPKVAIQNDAVSIVLDLDKIPEFINKVFEGSENER